MFFRFRTVEILILAALLAPPAFAASYVVCSDKVMVERSDMIVVGNVLSVYTQPTATGSVETVAVISVSDVMKGSPAQRTVEVHVPGGRFGDQSVNFAGAPHFEPGEDVLLFLRNHRGHWVTTEFGLGKFAIVDDVNNTRVAVRSDVEVEWWDLNGQPHTERRRSTDRFVKYLRDVAAGIPAAEDYYVETRPLRDSGAIQATTKGATIMATSYAPSTYTMDCGGGIGCRWNIFPSAVSWVNQNTEPGASNGGIDAFKQGLGTWTNDCASNVVYQYAGQNSAATGGLTQPDGFNAIKFETNLSSFGVAPYSCGSGGTIAIGGVTSTSGQHKHPVSGETFYTAVEGDVAGNVGLANCTSFLTSGDFITGLTHEIGHTLGLRHSNQDRSGGGACPSSYECSSSAVMNSVVVHGLNGVLQTWDVDAIGSVYPGGSCTPTCTPPSIAGQPASTTITAGQSATLTVTATGTTPLSYQWYTGTSGGGTPISGATGSSVTVTPSATTSYWVKVTNTCGSANSATATVTVNTAPPPSTFTPTGVRGPMDFNGDAHSDLLWRSTATGWLAMWEMNGRTPLNTAGFAQVADLNWRVEGAGDFNGDGKSDIIWRHTNDGAVAMWEMNDRTVLNGASMVSVPDLNWQIEAIGDFNADGRAEIIWRHQVTGQVAMWEVNGHTLLNGAIFYTVSDLNWRIVATGDFNGDGRSDLIWRNFATGDLAMWEMNGRTIINGAIFATVSDLNWHVEGAGDFNGDHYADLIWRNYATGDTAMWEMRGRTVLNGASITVVPLAWQIVALGDYDANGITDIVWRNNSTGDLAMWYVNGHTLVNPNIFATVSDLTWVIQPPRRDSGATAAATISYTEPLFIPVAIDDRRRRVPFTR